MVYAATVVFVTIFVFAIIVVDVVVFFVAGGVFSGYRCGAPEALLLVLVQLILLMQVVLVLMRCSSMGHRHGLRHLKASPQTMTMTMTMPLAVPKRRRWPVAPSKRPHHGRSIKMCLCLSLCLLV